MASRGQADRRRGGEAAGTPEDPGNLDPVGPWAVLWPPNAASVVGGMVVSLSRTLLLTLFLTM